MYVTSTKALQCLEKKECGLALQLNERPLLAQVLESTTQTYI